MAAASVLLRALLLAVSTHHSGITLMEHAMLHDGWEYLRLAQAFGRFDTQGLDPQTLRLFPGYPIAVALLGFGHFPVMAAIGISFLCAAAIPGLTDLLGRQRGLGWWMIALTPSWLLYTSTAMSEGLSTLTIVLCLLMIQRERWATAGLLAGLSAITRPVGALLFVVVVWEAMRRRNARPLVRSLLTGLPIPLLHLLLSRLLWGDALQSVSSYVSKDFAWPLSSFLWGSLGSEVGLDQRALIWVVIIASVMGGIGLWRQWQRGSGHLAPLLVWHSLALSFYLLLPSDWAFRAFDRFALALWPTTVIGLAPLIPQRRAFRIGLILLLSAVSFAVALRWLLNMAALFPFTDRLLPQ